MPKYTVMTFFWWSSVPSAKFGQTHAAVTIMETGNHVTQFSDEGHENNFWKIIVEI